MKFVSPILRFFVFLKLYKFDDTYKSLLLDLLLKYKCYDEIKICIQNIKFNTKDLDKISAYFLMEKISK